MDEAITNVATNARAAPTPKDRSGKATSASSREIAFALIKEADGRVQTEAGADETIILIPHAAAPLAVLRAEQARDRRAWAPKWAVALATLLVAFPAAWLIWPAAAPDNPPVQGASTPISATPAHANISPVSVVPIWAAPVPGSPDPAPRTNQPAAAPPLPELKPERHGFTIETASEPEIVKHVPTAATPDLSVFQFAPNPRVLVLDFTSLRGQGRMLNRTAALVEKLGLPHDRVLSDAELDTAIRASGSSAETFYYGHDYGSASLRRFFALADRDHVRLLNDEEMLRQLMQQEGWSEPASRGALISIPQADPNEHITLSERVTILHHELSHGEYFTNPAYAAFVHRFWTHTLTGSERDRIRDRLQTLGYDPALDELMENEAQAYLMFTEGKEFFTPAMFGMSDGRLTELRDGFFRTMPAGWLRDSLGRSLKAQSPNTAGKSQTSGKSSAKSQTSGKNAGDPGSGSESRPPAPP